MPRKKGTAGQYSMDDYRLKQVDIRLKLMEGRRGHPTTARRRSQVRKAQRQSCGMC